MIDWTRDFQIEVTPGMLHVGVVYGALRDHMRKTGTQLNGADKEALLHAVSAQTWPDLLSLPEDISETGLLAVATGQGDPRLSMGGIRPGGTDLWRSILGGAPSIYTYVDFVDRMTPERQGPEISIFDVLTLLVYRLVAQFEHWYELQIWMGGLQQARFLSARQNLGALVGSVGLPAQILSDPRFFTATVQYLQLLLKVTTLATGYRFRIGQADEQLVQYPPDNTYARLGPIMFGTTAGDWVPGYRWRMPMANVNFYRSALALCDSIVETGLMEDGTLTQRDVAAQSKLLEYFRGIDCGSPYPTAEPPESGQIPGTFPQADWWRIEHVVVRRGALHVGVLARHMWTQGPALPQVLRDAVRLQWRWDRCVLRTWPPSNQVPPMFSNGILGTDWRTSSLELADEVVHYMGLYRILMEDNQWQDGMAQVACEFILNLASGMSPTEVRRADLAPITQAAGGDIGRMASIFFATLDLFSLEFGLHFDLPRGFGPRQVDRGNHTPRTEAIVDLMDTARLLSARTGQLTQEDYATHQTLLMQLDQARRFV